MDSLVRPLTRTLHKVLVAILELKKGCKIPKELEEDLPKIIEELYNYAGLDPYRHTALSEAEKIRRLKAHTQIGFVDPYDSSKVIMALEIFGAWLRELILPLKPINHVYWSLLEEIKTTIGMVETSAEIFNRPSQGFKLEKYKLRESKGDPYEVPEFIDPPFEDPFPGPSLEVPLIEEKSTGPVRPLSYYQKHPYWKDAIKNIGIRVETGKYKNLTGKILKWNGSLVWILFDGEETRVAVTREVKVTLMRG